MNKGKNCAIIGEPPMSYVWGYDEEDQRCCATKLLLLNRLSRLQTEGITDFFIPLDAGMGLYAAEMVIALVASNPNLHLHCLIHTKIRHVSGLRNCGTGIIMFWKSVRILHRSL